MAKIIEYLSVDGIFSFLANTAAPASPSNTAIDVLRNGNHNGIFVKGDSFILMAYGIMLPENFTFFSRPSIGLPSLRIYGRSVSASPLGFALPCFQSSAPQNTNQYLIEENKELEINGFCNYNDFKDPARVVVSDNFSLLAGIINAIEISMLNVPAAANGERYYITPFVKVSHNFPLI